MFVRQLHRLSRLPTLTASPYCTTAAAVETDIIQSQRPKLAPSEFRTAETNAAAHSEMHLAKFYTIPPDQKKQIFGGGGLPRKFETQAKTFTETSLMVRPPAVEVINYIKASDLSRPVVRYVLYGENGTGKSLTMAHIIHYGFQNNFLLVHVPWAPNWMKRPKETANVTGQEGLFDLPFDSAAWLVHFKNQNANLLPRLNLTTSQDYVWSKRETTPKGSTLNQLVEHGIARIKFATDTIAALLAELKQHSTAGRCKVLVAIDGFNAFFHPETRIFGENKTRITPDRITLTQPFLNITKYDWTNGVCVLTVDKIGMTEGYMESYMPRYLLGKEGFEHLDPFVPIRVDGYTDKEFTSCVKYYLDCSWIQKTPEDLEEQLKYMSNKNPYNLMELTRSL